MPILGRDETPRHVVYLAALGVYKFSHTPGSFVLPVWVRPYAPLNSQEYDELTDNPHVKSHDWVRALIPHQSAKLTTEDLT